MAFCIKCGQEIADNLKFCTSCGAKQDEQIYPIIKKTRPQSITGIISAILFGTLAAHQLYRGILWYLDYGPEYSSSFNIIMWVVLIIGLLIILIASIANLKQEFYDVNCPYCNQQVLFPVEEQGINCSCCDKRMILVNGKVQKIEEDTNHENL